MFTTCTNPIIHLFYPPKICIGIVFDFEIASNGYAKDLGVIEVYYGIVQVVNGVFSRDVTAAFLVSLNKGTASLNNGVPKQRNGGQVGVPN